jgi:DHA1 family tetracycline resistance protein-like MFS transporter
MADISNDSNRSANFGMIGAAFGLGFILGPAVGGLLSGHGVQAPFIAAAILNFLNFVFGFSLVPESLPPEKRRHIEWRNLNPLSSLMKLLSRSTSLALIGVYFLLFCAGQVHPSNWTLYTQLKFGWTAYEVGLSLTFVGLVIAFSQGGLTRILIPRLGEPRSVMVGLLAYVVCFAGFAFATKGWMMYAVMAGFALTGICVPALQSMISRETPSSEQGELQGTLTSLGSLASILGPLLFTTLFAHYTRPGNTYFPGVAYFSAAAISALAGALLLFSRGRTYFLEMPRVQR